MIHYSDIAIKGKEHSVSLKKLIGKPIEDIIGVLYRDYKTGEVFFSVCDIIFEGGARAYIDDHSHYLYPYRTSSELLSILQPVIMYRLYKERDSQSVEPDNCCPRCGSKKLFPILYNTQIFRKCIKCSHEWYIK
jgi:hypothetical protein